jgi:hypothetical protein
MGRPADGPTHRRTVMPARTHSTLTPFLTPPVAVVHAQDKLLEEPARLALGQPTPTNHVLKHVAAGDELHDDS